jgi:hypothetical protein
MLNCTGKNYESWRVKLEKRNLKEYASAAKGLVIVERTCIAKESLLGVETRDKSLKYVRVSRGTAERIMQNRACLSAEGSIVGSNGKEGYSCKFKWMQKITIREIHCKHFKGKMYARHGARPKTDLASFRGCQYAEGFCRTGGGMYIKWDVVPEVRYEYETVGTFDAVKVNNHLLIEELGLALTIKVQKNETVWVDREFRFTKLEVKKPELKTGGDSIAALRDELNSRFQFLIEMMRSPKAKAEYLCDVWNQIRLNERMMAISDPITYVRIKTGRKLVTAMSAGNFVLAFPCVAVMNLQWIGTKDKCYNGIPVAYEIAGLNRTHKGFLFAKHNIIEASGIEVSCHRKQPEISEVSGRVEWHHGHSQKVDTVNTSGAIDLTPRLDKGIGVIDFLETDWVYDASDLSDTQIDRLEIEEAYMEDAEGPASSEGEVDSLWQFLGIWNEKWSTMVNAVITWVERIVVVIICCKVFKSSCGGNGLCNRRGGCLQRNNASIEAGEAMMVREGRSGDQFYVSTSAGM